MAGGETADAVESPGASTDPSGQGGEPPKLASFFRRRMLFGVLGVVLVVGAAAVASRSDAEVSVPRLIGTRVDPQLDALRLRLEAADLALGDVTVGACPEYDIPGASLEQPPGTIIEQHPNGGSNVVTSTAVDVTVCLPETGSGAA
jgi:beta-lactam-binding protein with PASTA domain